MPGAQQIPMGGAVAALPFPTSEWGREGGRKGWRKHGARKSSSGAKGGRAAKKGKGGGGHSLRAPSSQKSSVEGDPGARRMRRTLRPLASALYLAAMERRRQLLAAQRRRLRHCESPSCSPLCEATERALQGLPPPAAAAEPDAPAGEEIAGPHAADVAAFARAADELGLAGK